MDGRLRKDFDMIDQFIADYALDLDVAEEAMALDSTEIAKMLVDINVPRAEIVRIAQGLTPAKITEVINQMNVVEIMMAIQKARARKRPGNQCHVTNVRDNPVQIAADAAEASVRGFDEQETTIGITRYAPFNALAILVGAQTGRGGVLTGAMEEAFELTIGMRGLLPMQRLYPYTTERVFIDGDDTPGLRPFGIGLCIPGYKMRFTRAQGRSSNGLCGRESMLSGSAASCLPGARGRDYRTVLSAV